MTDPVVIFEELPAANGMNVGKAVLNVPKTLNSLTIDMVELLLAKLEQWQRDEKICCVIISGSGDKAFCAGGDVQALHASAVKTPGGPCVEAEQFFAREYRMNHALHTYKKPILVWGDGIVMGGGLGILAGGSHRVVTETSRFAMPEITIALFPDVGGSYFLNQTPGKSGRFLALTGASFNAADALYLGVANLFIARDRYGDVESALLDAAPVDDAQVDAVLAAIADACASSLPSGNVEQHQHEIDSLCASASTREVVAAFRALETDDKWLSKAKAGLLHGSPLAALWIDRQLKQCEGMALADVFRSELVLATNIVRYPEFAEGVRALLIDKDRAPQWQYANVDAVEPETIDSFFAPPWDSNPLHDL
ncbi:MAG: enoyl-CoA hydratase/isomerase family protein [Gammaproteobacteria bacterium]|nr:enoyl-CoA hydratase/isomerase family protein [Gammaproteobacteria bacterium]NND38836.1 enoyl-CoA hydratase/isomerase family protein [Pseudomonadales bacterium]RZV49332.1 MAG: enoyl-CoA hydratase/isomerase family protein [Pseudomonadales bacterium]